MYRKDMLICRVLGKVISTCRQEALRGKKLLIVQEKHLKGTKKTMIAVDCVGARAGDTVIVNHEGGSSRMASQCPEGAVDAAITGIVDHGGDE
jgi:microcompartment protein CcmK/EutM